MAFFSSSLGVNVVRRMVHSINLLFSQQIKNIFDSYHKFFLGENDCTMNVLSVIQCFMIRIDLWFSFCNKMCHTCPQRGFTMKRIKMKPSKQ